MRHRKTVRHYHEIGHLHELTFSCYHRMPLLTNDSWRAILARRIDQAGEESAMELVGFVFMPEHVHLLVYPTGTNPAFGRYLARIRQPFSKHIKQLLMQEKSPLTSKLVVRDGSGGSCFRFWQAGPGFDRNLYSPEAISSSLEYIHNNPVNRGLCRTALDWRWSSARYYLSTRARRQYPGLPWIHGLPDGAIT